VHIGGNNVIHVFFMIFSSEKVAGAERADRAAAQMIGSFRTELQADGCVHIEEGGLWTSRANYKFFPRIAYSSKDLAGGQSLYQALDREAPEVSVCSGDWDHRFLSEA
jgi:hypothetical protein